MCKKGDIYWAELPRVENSRIQAGFRPVVITSNKFATEYSEVIQYMPITSNIKRTDLPVHVVINPEFMPKESMVLAEQEGIIDKHRLREKIGTLSDIDMMKIDMAKLVQGGIDILTIMNNMNNIKRSAV